MSYIDDCNLIYEHVYSAEYAAQLLKRRKQDKNRKKDARKKAVDETYLCHESEHYGEHRMVLPKLRGEEPTIFPPSEENARYVFGTRCHIAGPVR